MREESQDIAQKENYIYINNIYVKWINLFRQFFKCNYILLALHNGYLGKKKQKASKQNNL